MDEGVRIRFRWLRRFALWAAAVVVGVPLLCTLYLAVLPPAVTPLMLIRWVEGYGLEKSWRALDEIAPVLPQTVMAGEDNNFCRHHGFDLGAIAEAVDEWRDGGRLRGASTISQQTAKNLFLWPGGGLLRKGVEAYLTVWLEFLLGKRRIMELYLNIAEWGPGIYGAQAAAQHHFGRDAADLTGRQAALLAAVLPDPLDRSAGKPSGYVGRRAAALERRRVQLGDLTACVSPP